MSSSRIGCFPQGTGRLDSEQNAHQPGASAPAARGPATSIGECVMIIILGLIIVIAAVIAAVAGVLANDGSGHALAHGFAVLGYHVTGSAGTLFLDGIVTGAIGVAGLGLLLGGARRT